MIVDRPFPYLFCFITLCLGYVSSCCHMDGVPVGVWSPVSTSGGTRSRSAWPGWAPWPASSPHPSFLHQQVSGAALIALSFSYPFCIPGDLNGTRGVRCFLGCAPPVCTLRHRLGFVLCAAGPPNLH